MIKLCHSAAASSFVGAHQKRYPKRGKQTVYSARYLRQTARRIFSHGPTSWMGWDGMSHETSYVLLRYVSFVFILYIFCCYSQWLWGPNLPPSGTERGNGIPSGSSFWPGMVVVGNALHRQTKGESKIGCW